MADNLNIIGSKVLGTEFDAFWNADVVIAEGHRPTLILSTAFMPGGPEEQQLLKMLGACALSPDTYHLIHIPENSSIAWHQLRDRTRPENVILLGISPEQLGISAMMRFNEPNRFNDRIFIPTLALGDLEKQPEVKKQLWLNALKPVFVDKTFQKQQ